MTYTQEQINTEQILNRARQEETNLIKTDIQNGLYSMLDTCKLASAFNIFPAAYGKIVENLTKKIFGLSNPTNDSYGDATIYGEVGIEIKTSFTRPDGTLGLRQVRFHENIDYFLIVNFDDYNRPVNGSLELFTSIQTTENMGKILYYLLPREKMQELVLQFGNNTHGTGIITTESVQSGGREFSISYNPYANENSTPYRVWEHFQEFAHTENSLNRILCEIYNQKDGLLEI